MNIYAKFCDFLLTFCDYYGKIIYCKEQRSSLNKFYQTEELKMSRIKTIGTKDINATVKNGGCGECQTSCQSACKTSCGVANQKCENTNK